MQEKQAFTKENGWFQTEADGCLGALLHFPVTAVAIKRLKSPVPGIVGPSVLIIQCRFITVFFYSGGGSIHTTGGVCPEHGWKFVFSYLSKEFKLAHFALRDTRNRNDEGEPRFIHFSQMY